MSSQLDIHHSLLFNNLFILVFIQLNPMFKKRGQVSAEMMVILAMVFILLVFVLTVNDTIMTGIEGEYNSRKAKIAIDEVVNAGKLAYQQGEGAELKIYVTIPPHVDSIVMGGREINLTLNVSGEKNLIYTVTDFNVTGSIPSQEGNYWLRVKSERQYVNITNYYG